MKAKSLITALLLTVSAGSAFAQEFVRPDAGFVSTKTRAEVLQELVEANATRTSSVTVQDSEYPVVAAEPASAITGKTRAQVRAELEEYNRENPRGYLYTYYIGE